MSVVDIPVVDIPVVDSAVAPIVASAPATLPAVVAQPDTTAQLKEKAAQLAAQNDARKKLQSDMNVSHATVQAHQTQIIASTNTVQAHTAGLDASVKKITGLEDEIETVVKSILALIKTL